MKFYRYFKQKLLFNNYEGFVWDSNLNEFQKNLKGEITVVISEKKYLKQDIKKLTESDKKKIKILIKKLSIKDIINIFADEKNVSKKEIYNYCLFLKNEN